MRYHPPDFARLCHWLRAAIAAFVLVQLALFFGAWCAHEPLQLLGIGMRAATKGLSFDQVQLFTPAQRVLGAVVDFPALALLLAGVWQLNLMLLAFARTDFFSAKTIAYLRAFAGACALSFAWSAVAPMIRDGASRALLQTHVDKWSFSVNSEEIFTLLLCAVLYVIAHMMHEARRLAEENESFV